MNRSVIDSVPNPVLFSIFSLLDLRDIGRCAQVCRRWQRLTEDETLRAIVCENLGDQAFLYPNFSWVKACHYYFDDRTFSVGKTKESSFPIRNLLYSLVPSSIKPAVYNDTIAFYEPLTSSIQFWNWKLSLPIKQFKTDRDGVSTDWTDCQSYLELNGKYLIYTLNYLQFSSRIYVWELSGGFYPRFSFHLPGKETRCQLSHDILSSTCYKYPGVNNGWKKTVCLSIYNLGTSCKESDSKSIYRTYHRHLKGDGVDFKNPIVHYKDVFIFIRRANKITVLNYEKSTEKNYTFYNKLNDSDAITANLQLNILCIYSWCYADSKYYCNSISVWDIDKSTHIWQNDTILLNLRPDGAYVDPLRDLLILKNANEICIYNRELKKIRKIESTSSPSSCSSMYLSGNHLLILDKHKAHSIEFCTGTKSQ